ncbi:hypothetical protein BSKO_13560 [Bryopsis sp. KO-2023]|nr:hypothetical protein BSKO_13560 [Bryopsis sp. KO-2023]
MVWPFRRRRRSAKQKEELDSARATTITTENWDEQDCKITVTEKKGFLCRVQLRAKINCPPDQVFDVLVDPENARYFRTVKAVTFRKVLKDAGLDGEKKVEIEQAAGWRFLLFSGLFFTRLFVSENKRKGTIQFKLAEQGVMKDFEGLWKIQPFTQTTVNEAMGQGSRFSRFSGRLISGVTGAVHKPQASLVTLEQSVAPSMEPPKAMKGYMTKITANIVANIVEDLKGEIQRIQDGKPIPKGQMKKLQKAQKLKKSELPEIVRTVGSIAFAQAARMPCRNDRFASMSFKPWSAPAREIPFIEEIE